MAVRTVPSHGQDAQTVGIAYEVGNVLGVGLLEELTAVEVYGVVGYKELGCNLVAAHSA